MVTPLAIQSNEAEGPQSLETRFYAAGWRQRANEFRGGHLDSLYGYQRSKYVLLEPSEAVEIALSYALTIRGQVRMLGVV